MNLSDMRVSPQQMNRTRSRNRVGMKNASNSGLEHLGAEHEGKLSEVVIEALERVPDEWQTHLGRLLHCRGAALLDGLRLENRGIVGLINLIGREVGSINVGGQTWLKGRANATKAVELDTSEECMVLNLMRSTTAKTVFCVADHAIHCQ